MNDKKTCKIIQDLLPSYIDRLTNDETTNFIEQHLVECNECQKMLEEMKSALKIETEKANKRDLKYMKKFNKKFKLLLIIIYIIGIVIIVSSFRKVIIVKKLLKNSENFLNISNYHKTTYNYFNEGASKVDVYVKDNNMKIVSISYLEDGIAKQTMYLKKVTGKANEYSVNMYHEKNGEKINAVIDERLNFIDFGIGEDVYFGNGKTFRTFLDTIPVTIKSTVFNGRECYYMTNFSEFGMLSNGYGNGAYFDKETGLPIYFCSYEEYVSEKKINKQKIPALEFVYEFNCVTDDEFIEPDISEYEVTKSISGYYETFSKKFTKNITGKNGKAVKELLNVFIENIQENKIDSTKLPDILYIEEFSQDAMRLKGLNGISDLTDNDLREIGETEVFQSPDGSFEFKYDAEGSFRIVSDSENTNEETISELMSKINDDDEYHMTLAIDLNDNVASSALIDAIIINKR